MESYPPVFCTIITGDHIHYALTLRHSLVKYNKDAQLYILTTDISTRNAELLQEFENVLLLSLEEVCDSGMGKSIYNKYFERDMDAFRWSMKPVFITHLLRNRDVRKVMYVDCDIYFFNDYSFLFEQLSDSNVLLTPHWRSSDPHRDPANFGLLYTNGLYNGGFIGANEFAIPAMDWWAMACEYVCVKDTSSGLFVDQVHLNILPVYFENIGIVRHRGCNVANWNMTECYRVATGNGTEVFIADEYPVIFIHFTGSMLKGILSGQDILLQPYLEEYYNVNSGYADTFKLPCIDLETVKPKTPKQFQSADNTFLLKKKVKAFLKNLFPVVK